MNSNLNIYFSMAISGGRQKQPTGKDLIDFCKTLGFVLNDYIGKRNVLLHERKKLDIYSRNGDWINHADVMIAEVSIHSFGVGMEVEKAINHNIPVLCLYDKIMLNENEVSRMLTTCKYIKLVGYKTNADAKRIISEFIEEVVSESKLAVPGHPECKITECNTCHNVSCQIHQGFEE